MRKTRKNGDENMKLFEYIKRLFKRKKQPVKSTLKKAELKHVVIKKTPITHPTKYRKFFKKRQPTTARKLWRPNAKLEDDKE